MTKRSVFACVAALAAMVTTMGCTKDTKAPADAGPTPVGPVCKPACLTDQYCDDVNNDPPLCVSVCTNDSVGCKNGLVCDAASKTCVGPTCSTGEKCEQGQGCYDVATILTISPQPGDICTCLPGGINPQTGAEIKDSCAPFGKVCNVDRAHPAATACTMPGEFEQCDKSVGCQQGFECNTLGAGRPNYCSRKCTRTDDCPNPATKCYGNTGTLPPAVKQHCWFNFCGTDAGGNTDRTQYFKACSASAGGDGICIPQSDPSSGDDYAAFCMQTGSAASLGECDPKAVRPAKADMCPQGQFCEVIMPAQTGHKGGICRAVCNAAPGPNKTPIRDCDPGLACTDESGVASTAISGLEARLGFCRATCDLLGTTETCGDDVLGNHTGCQANSGRITQTGVCLSEIAQPFGVGGGPCNYYMDPAGGDWRMDCDSRSICLNDNMCHSWCDRTVCTNQQVDCTQCAAGEACVNSGGANQDTTVNKMGWCVSH